MPLGRRGWSSKWGRLHLGDHEDARRARPRRAARGLRRRLAGLRLRLRARLRTRKRPRHGRRNDRCLLQRRDGSSHEPARARRDGPGADRVERGDPVRARGPDLRQEPHRRRDQGTRGTGLRRRHRPARRSAGAHRLAGLTPRRGRDAPPAGADRVTMTTARRVPIAVPRVGEEEWRARREPLESGWLTQGPKVAAFEEAFAQRHTVEHALATTSCTTGLHLALAALGVGPGDEVLIPGFTWVATANVVRYCGATPVFVDVDPATYNVDPDALAAKVTPRTRAALPVHLFGLCADMDAVRA